MTNKLHTTVTQLKYKDWIIDIIESDDKFEAWLQKKNYGQKISFCGWIKGQENINRLEDFVDLTANVLEDAMKWYMEDIEILETYHTTQIKKGVDINGKKIR